MENKRRLGEQKEAVAAEYLEANGLKVLCRNYYYPGGEIDIIAKDKDYLVFVEVKYRKNTAYGFPAEAVTKAKQKKLLLGARQYLYRNRLSFETPCRFDVISIEKEEILWMPNAFSVS